MKYFFINFLNLDKEEIFTYGQEIGSYKNFMNFIDSMLKKEIVLKNKTYIIKSYIVNYQKPSFDEENLTINIYCSIK